MGAGRVLLIYGYGGLAREICSLAKMLNRWDEIGYIEDDLSKVNYDLGVYSRGFMESEFLKSPTGVDVVLGFADTKQKKDIYEGFSGYKNVKFPKIVSPLAYVDPDAEIMDGCVVSHFCFVSCGVKIGKMSFLNVSCTVGHDAVIGDFVSSMPSVSISGNVSIGERVFIGSKSFILQGKSVGNGVMIGAGSNVMTDLKDNERVYAQRSMRFKNSASN
jgi:sugar O-acyltransferase (sialic acid O-acetyltransferase NeuD family)